MERRKTEKLVCAVRKLVAVTLAVAALMWTNPVLATHDEVALINGCNEQGVGETGFTIRWTSAFTDQLYRFIEESRNGSIASGAGEVLEMTVQWSIHDTAGKPAGVPSRLVGIGPRGPGFSPEGVQGMFVVDTDGHAPEVQDPSECGIDPTSQSYRNATVYFKFTKLHRPGKRQVAKGNAEFNLFVDAGEDENSDGKPDLGTATLGTNLHVATGPDPDP